MKQFWRLTSFIAVLFTPFILGGQVSAESVPSMSIGHEITITAVVPSHRDIILDVTGHIVQINSNTKEDVTPDVYRQSAIPENSEPLTPELLAAYRQLVPVGTAKFGVLYKQSPLATVTKPTGSGVRTSAAALTSQKFTSKQSILSRIFRSDIADKQFAFISN